MRARLPDDEGIIRCCGVDVGYEVFGTGDLTILLLPTWTIVHSHVWKMQVPYLADHARVISFDRPGNGRSDRSLDPAPYRTEAVCEAALAVMDATATDAAVLVSLSLGAREALLLAAEHRERVLGCVFIGPALLVEPDHPERAEASARFFDRPPEQPQGWERQNAQYWLDHYDDFVEFFFDQCFVEPHSTKQREDCRGWAAQTSPEILLADLQAGVVTPDVALAWARRMSCPSLVIHGELDQISPVSRAATLADATGGELVVLDGAGHLPLARDPVRVNLLIREFAERACGRGPTRPRWARAVTRPRRALFVSSPIGLGHARRDIAIADELRSLHPDLEIEWLAQHPVTRMLHDAGERVHPASSRLANESAHMVSECGEHRLHCFQAWRRMDEILLADFMVFHDVVTTTEYDLVVGDEAWEIDYYLHENPELKRFAYCWITDFVGWLPVPGAHGDEVALTTDYNAEMIEQIARFPRIRDLALFVGNPDDIVPDRFGHALPSIREWTESHYQFPGYVTGFDPSAFADREAVRHQLGYDPDEQLCVVTVGGSGVGGDLLRRLIAAHPVASTAVPGLRTLIVAGPRIDPASLPFVPGVEIVSYVPDLHRHLAASDLAVVQGGLTTCMELTASGRPFVYLPLIDHFEQQHHVHHRLRGHDAGIRMDYDQADPDHLAEVIAAQIGTDTAYRPVEHDGARRAAAAIAELL